MPTIEMCEWLGFCFGCNTIEAVVMYRIILGCWRARVNNLAFSFDDIGQNLSLTQEQEANFL